MKSVYMRLLLKLAWPAMIAIITLLLFYLMIEKDISVELYLAFGAMLATAALGYSVNALQESVIKLSKRINELEQN